MEKQNIRIKLRAYDNKILDASTEEIVNTVKRTGATIKGPIPLPTRIERYTVLRSPHIDKKSREQFEYNVHLLSSARLRATSNKSSYFFPAALPTRPSLVSREIGTWRGYEQSSGQQSSSSAHQSDTGEIFLPTQARISNAMNCNSCASVLP